jgi:hypothetical protein
MLESEDSHFWSGREKIIGSIVSPLGFFVLALLIVEGFLFGAGKYFDLPVETRSRMVWAGIAIFAVVIGLVMYLVIKHPQSLVFSEKSHIQFAQLRSYGDNSIPDAGQVAKMVPVLSPAPASSQPLQIETGEKK